MMDILNWGITTEWLNENKTLHLVLFLLLWLIIGVVGSAILHRCIGNEGGEINMIWFLWLLFGWAFIVMITAFPVLSIITGGVIYIGYVVCSKLYALIVNYGKEKDDEQ